jgi:nucleotide-binding universal stress UspA family protein
MLPIRHILHPTDFSDPSRPAFTLACALARDFGAELTVLNVSPPPVASVVDGVAVDVAPDDPAAEREQMLARLEQMAGIDPQVRIVPEWARGDPVREILRVAQEGKSDLIVMGTHGRGGLMRLLMGSVAEGVMRKAPCPVLTLKGQHPKDEAPEPEAAVAGQPTRR